MNCRTCAGPCALKGSRIEVDCEWYKPLSHYDQIKTMSIEEMAEFISGKARTFGEEYEGYVSALDWLRQEAEHE